MCVRKLARSSGHEAFEKLVLYISEVEELNSKPVPGENVRDPAFERHRRTFRRGYINGQDISDDYLNDRVDVASTCADITDSRCTAS